MPLCFGGRRDWCGPARSTSRPSGPATSTPSGRRSPTRRRRARPGSGRWRGRSRRRARCSPGTRARCRRRSRGRNRACCSSDAEGDERGAEQRLADVADAPGRAGPGVLLEVDDLLVQRQPPAAVLLRPGDAGPAVGAEVALPGQALLEEAVLVAGSAPAPRRRRSRRRSDSSRNVRTSSRNASSSALKRRSIRRTLPRGPDGPSDPVDPATPVCGVPVVLAADARCRLGRAARRPRLARCRVR